MSGPAAWREVDPDARFPGPLLLLVPHMDDCVLGCGGTLARLADAARVHVLYATDGKRSPEPLLPWRDRVDTETLGRDRVAEARAALARLGVPEENVRFLGLPDGGLRRVADVLARGVEAAVERLRPRWLLAPFRFDRHPDHLALNRAATALHRAGGPELVEYFVYQHSRLLPRGDVRRYVRPGQLVRVEIDTVAERKAEALRAFRSQTTRYYPWQTRPNLTPQLIEAVSRVPETFLPYDPRFAGSRIFASGATWIRLAQRLEPTLKRRKDQAVAAARRLLRS